MSYILEALKKSQQKRELGHVPTLGTPTFLAEEEGSRPNLWILLAVVMAALAVLIAMYSALRGGAPNSESLTGSAQTDQMATPGERGPDAAVSVQSPSQPLARPLSRGPASAPFGSGRTVGPSRDREPARLAIESPAAVMVPPAAPAQSQPPDIETPAGSEPPVAPLRSQSRKTPPDLIADIEAFKQKIRKEQSGTEDTAQSGSEIAPQDLRLPRDVRKRLPEFVLSAHIYDEDPSKRFVLINGLKTREGEESREEITVEQILPDGVVLSFEGHRFFRRRR